MLHSDKRRVNGNLFKAWTRLCSSFVSQLPCACSLKPGPWMPPRHWRVSCCFHIVPRASPQQWPTWESRPGAGINQLPPSPGGLLPVHHAVAPGPGPPGFVPHESLLEFTEMRIVCSQKPAERLYFAWKFDMVAPWDNTEGGGFKLSFCWTINSFWRLIF